MSTTARLAAAALAAASLTFAAACDPGDSTDTAAPKKTSTAAPRPHSSTLKPAPDPTATTTPKGAPKPAKTKSATTAVFKVWGTAPAGALGPLDIQYGSDSDTRQGKFANGSFSATMPVTDTAMYFAITAQLQGSGDIHCSVTIGDKTAAGHAQGGFNICSVQLNGGLFGGWE